MSKSNDKITPGDKFTIAGCGYAADGEFVFNGYTKDGRPVEVVRLIEYVAGKVSEG